MTNRNDSEDVIIKITDVGKIFEGVKPLRSLTDVDLEVVDKEFISIVGPSGCGKTTLLRIIAGLESASEGTITVAGETKEDWNTGFVFQDPNLLPWRTVIDNTVLALELEKQDPTEYYEKARKLLDMVELAGYEDFYPKDLSGGMKQRVAIARSLVHDPVVLLMDEPFAALDEITRTKMNFELRRIWQQTSKTIIYVTHDVDEAVLLSDRVVVMSPQPGTIKKVIDINLPLERDIGTKDTEQFIKHRIEVREALRSVNETSPSEIEKIEKKSSHPAAAFFTNHDRLKYYFMYAAVFALFIGLWESFIRAFDIPTFLVPAPGEVFSEYLRLFSSGTLMKHTIVTLKETLLGFVAGSILGIGIGYPLAKSRKVERIFSPYVVAAQTAPKIAIAPLIVIWFGFGITSKIILVMLIVFFPILINTVLGIKSVDKNQIELLKSTRASKLQMFTKLELPSALPVIFAGFKTGITLAVIGAVVGEFVGANAGLGYLTIYASGLMDTPQVFAAIIQLTLLGVVLYALITVIGARLMPWRAEEEE